MPDLNELDRRVLGSLTGRAKLDALLTDAGLPTVRSVAMAFGEAADDVSRCLSGHTGRRPTMDRIRDKIASAVGLERSEVDSLLGGPIPAEGAA